MNPPSAVGDRLNLVEVGVSEESPGFAADVLAGLSGFPKTLPSVYFYDEAGSRLFEEICRLPEYYLTRCEAEILRARAEEIAACSSGRMELVELGSGSSVKTRLLIEALLRRQGRLHYLPVDISRSMLAETSKRLLADYPDLRITAYAAEYEAGLHRIAGTDFHQKMVLFLGSNIGNLRLDEAVAFLTRIRADLKEGDFLLVGADLQKDPARLTAAYDDARGVTAEFNKNVLRRINSELGGAFDLERFRHLAFWNPAHSRMEMHLQSLGAAEYPVAALDRSFRFFPGETIHTENSYKYSFEQLDDLCGRAGLKGIARHLDGEGLFSLNLLAPR